MRLIDLDRYLPTRGDTALFVAPAMNLASPLGLLERRNGATPEDGNAKHPSPLDIPWARRSADVSMNGKLEATTGFEPMYTDLQSAA